jgi:hypothetical protein
MTQLVVVVQVLIAKRNPKHPLPNQSHDLVLDQILLSHIVKARRESEHHPDRTIRLAHSNRQKVVVAQPLSLIRGPDALRLGEICALGPGPHWRPQKSERHCLGDRKV